MTRRPRALVAMSPDAFDQLFDDRGLARLAALADVPAPAGPTDLSDPAGLAALSGIEVLVTSWGCPPLTAELLEHAPKLEAVFHAAGSIKQHITPACWERGITVTTAADANAIPVAEYTMAAVMLSGKRFFEYATRYREAPGTWSPWRDRIRDGTRYPHTVGIVGLSRIGRRVAEALRAFDLTVLASDPYARPEDAAALGVHLVDLDELAAASTIVTLHAPLLSQTRHLLDRRRLGLLPDGATVINTARGGLVDHDALTAECLDGRLSAVLDVTDPEPLPADSPLYRLANVTLTPHIAGALGGETRRMTDLALDELDRYRRGVPLRHQVHPDELDRIA
ncbi:hydroxyacid dehydrogenase [Rugosimonospora acidiphila]|uniref:Hydroxyacid dehydrogenase n=1 Tax=Rugosimonospora acidiphila TaxID=556531 RepID=A0ABP9SBR4_9ACTN